MPRSRGFHHGARSPARNGWKISPALPGGTRAAIRVNTS